MIFVEIFLVCSFFCFVNIFSVLLFVFVNNKPDLIISSPLVFLVCGTLDY